MLLFRDVVITPILPVEYSFTEAQSNIGWMTEMDEKAPGASASGQSYNKTLNNTVSVHAKKDAEIEHSTLPDYPTFQQPFCKLFWLLQHVFSVIKQHIFLGVL